MTATPQPPGARRPRPAGRRAHRRRSSSGSCCCCPASGCSPGRRAALGRPVADRDDGYLYTATDDFTTPGHALVSERIDLATGADWVPLSAALGTARVEVTGSRSGRGRLRRASRPSADVDGLPGRRGAHASSTTSGSTPRPPTRSSCPVARRPGRRPTRTSGRRRPAGPGTQQLDWDPAEGDWTARRHERRRVGRGGRRRPRSAPRSRRSPGSPGACWAAGCSCTLLGRAAARGRAAPSRPRSPGHPPAGPPPSWTPPPAPSTAARRPTRSRAGRPAPLPGGPQQRLTRAPTTSGPGRRRPVPTSRPGVRRGP